MLKHLENITIFSVLGAVTLYVFISIIAGANDGFPFLVGALFLLATTVAVVLIGQTLRSGAISERGIVHPG